MLLHIRIPVTSFLTESPPSNIFEILESWQDFLRSNFTFLALKPREL
jgi:hypothetical protein